MFKSMLMCGAICLLVTGASPQSDSKLSAGLAELQGTWNVVALEMDGAKTDDKILQAAKITVTGDTFATSGMGNAYKGTLKADNTTTPKKLDMEFTDGPEKGKASLAIYERNGDTLRICLTVAKRDRPTEFATKPDSGLALETFKRDQGDKKQDAAKKDMDLLQGEWTMVSGEINGQSLPEAMLKGSKRVVKGNETSVTVAGKMFFKATTTLDPTKKPKTVDYAMTDGPTKGKTQLGIYELDGDNVKFCFAAPGKDRPTDFTTKMGDDRTLGIFKRAKK